ncbi:MAG: hypothetical protein OEV28_04765 [Nitrospirota bacterium]|nr:hypothetical protein [Nitrospirota bacterium]
MKKIYSILLAGVMTVGITAVGQAGEYRNMMDLAKFEAALGDQASYGTYRNIIDRESFELALTDQMEWGVYKNIIDREHFIASLADDTDFGAYRNLTTREAFMLALGDQSRKGTYESERIEQLLAFHGPEGVADRDMIVSGRWIGPFELLPGKTVYHAADSFGLL